MYEKVIDKAAEGQEKKEILNLLIEAVSRLQIKLKAGKTEIDKFDEKINVKFKEKYTRLIKKDDEELGKLHSLYMEMLNESL